jgi:serine/threonine protein kinase
MFWDKHSSSKPSSDFYSNDFKNLFLSMVQLEPTQRPSIQEVLSHPWFQKDEMPIESVQQELNSRLSKIREAQEEARLQRRAARTAGDVNMSGVSRNSDLLDQIAKMEETFNPKNLNKKIKTTDGPFMQNATYFFSMTSPDIIELDMLNWLNKAKNVHSVDKDKYKMKFTLTGKNLDGEDYEVVIKMQMLQYQDRVYIEFQKISGDQFFFMKHYMELVQGTKVKKDDKVVEHPGPLAEYDNLGLDTLA